MREMRVALFFAGNALVLSAAAAAPPTAPQIVTLQECRSLADPSARLSCFDKAVDELSAATASQDIVVVERSEVRKARKGLFGFTLPKIGLLASREGNLDDEADAAQLSTKILDARALAYGKWRFTVEDGAIWETVESSISLATPKADRPVRIEAGALGSYMAKVGNGGWVRVRRIQ